MILRNHLSSDMTFIHIMWPIKGKIQIFVLQSPKKCTDIISLNLHVKASALFSEKLSIDISRLIFRNTCYKNIGKKNEIFFMNSK